MSIISVIRDIINPKYRQKLSDPCIDEIEATAQKLARVSRPPCFNEAPGECEAEFIAIATREKPDVVANHSANEADKYEAEFIAIATREKPDVVANHSANEADKYEAEFIAIATREKPDAVANHSANEADKCEAEFIAIATREKPDFIANYSGNESLAEQELIDKLSSHYKKAYSLIQKELKLAAEEGRKLLIILGEAHGDPNCILSELIVCAAAYVLGIQDILAEGNDRSWIDKQVGIAFDWKSEEKTSYHCLMAILLRMGCNLYCVDPLSNENSRDILADADDNTWNNWMVARNLAMSNTIANLSSNSHSIFIGGNNHLLHLVEDDKLSQYRLLPITTIPRDALGTGELYTPKGIIPVDEREWCQKHAIISCPSHFNGDWPKTFQAMSQIEAIQKHEKFVPILKTLGSNIAPFMSLENGRLNFWEDDRGDRIRFVL